MLRLFATDQEYNVALGRVNVGVFQQEHPVHAVLLQHGELDEQPYWTGQILADNEVLLASNLSGGG